jgi:F-type H+-transporting ATPase subunit epsilon
MAAKISLEIVTPEGVQLSRDVDEFTAPSVEGEFGVLPGHRPLLAGLRTGIVRYQVGGDSFAVAVGPGFAKVQDDTAQLLTDSFVKKEEVDAVVARKDLKEAEEKLATLSPESDTAEMAPVVKAARWAAVRLELYGDPPPATVIIAQETRLLGHEDYSALVSKAETETPEDGASH